MRFQLCDSRLIFPIYEIRWIGDDSNGDLKRGWKAESLVQQISISREGIETDIA